MRILILGSHMNYNLEHYLYAIANRLGHNVEFYGYRSDLGALAGIVRMAVTRSKSLRGLANSSVLDGVNRRMKRLATSLCPDLVLAIKGEAVRPDTISWLS